MAASAPGVLVALAAVEQRRARPGRPRAVEVFAGEIALRQRRIGEQADLFAHRDLGQGHLIGAVERDCRRSAPRRTRGRPASPHAEEASSCPRRSRWRGRNGGSFLPSRGRPGSSSVSAIGLLASGVPVRVDGRVGAPRHRAVRPVDLVEVDIVGLEPLRLLSSASVDLARG